MEIIKEKVTWKQFEIFIEETLKYINRNKLKFTGVYGVPRGGLTIATKLSYKLDIPLLLAPLDNCLIVDDIADSGRTLLHFTRNDTQESNYKIVTMYYHERSIVKPDFFLYNKENKWIEFPWEV